MTDMEMDCARVTYLALAAGLAAVTACGGGPAPAPLSCATAATPDLKVGAQFSVDTGVAPSATGGASYGQRACPGAFLVEVDLGRAQPRTDFFVSGGWSATLPGQPCDETSTMSVFALEGDHWKVWDVIAYRGQTEGALCHAQAVSHTNMSSAGLGGALIAAESAVQTVRVAVEATQDGSKVPIYLAGD